MKIKAIGVGDTGCRIVNKIGPELIEHVKFFAVNAGTQLPVTTQSAFVTWIGDDLRHEIKQIPPSADMILIVADAGEIK
ncbi:hypothetical protein ACFLWF_01595, partial [Chloroflexota bacterium]